MSDSHIIDDKFLSGQFRDWNAANVTQWKDLAITAACCHVGEQGIRSKADLQVESKAAFDGFVKYYCSTYQNEMPKTILDTDALQRINYMTSVSQGKAKEITGEYIWRRWTDCIKRTSVNQFAPIFCRLFPKGKLPSGDNKEAAILKYRQALWEDSKSKKTKVKQATDLTGSSLSTSSASSTAPDGDVADGDELSPATPAAPVVADGDDEISLATAAPVVADGDADISATTSAVVADDDADISATTSAVVADDDDDISATTSAGMSIPAHRSLKRKTRTVPVAAEIESDMNSNWYPPYWLANAAFGLMADTCHQQLLVVTSSGPTKKSSDDISVSFSSPTNWGGDMKTAMAISNSSGDPPKKNKSENKNGSPDTDPIFVESAHNMKVMSESVTKFMVFETRAAKLKLLETALEEASDDEEKEKLKKRRKFLRDQAIFDD